MGVWAELQGLSFETKATLVVAIVLAVGVLVIQEGRHFVQRRSDQQAALRDKRAIIQIQGHQGQRGAAVAFGYFVHGREVVLGGGERPLETGSSCNVILTGETSVTRYVRAGNLLVRVSHVGPPPAVLMGGAAFPYRAAADSHMATLTKAPLLAMPLVNPMSWRGLSQRTLKFS